MSLLYKNISFPFCSRWLRLLFGREFQIFDLLLLWDAIFAEGNHFELTNYIVVAMLISIREESTLTTMKMKFFIAKLFFCSIFQYIFSASQ